MKSLRPSETQIWACTARPFLSRFEYRAGILPLPYKNTLPCI
ncbi:hypothetical protein NEIFLAOT_00778 [Neisseria flavescens NRL30031/H210]|uniref:Uncharacterized protein n=1 Tax=Neisseria flavescens NRL30031/H210 TaxID=546264 RepID=C0ELH3_NEIFL|nr:hypothetical protein NEIFLAOT_00778 [Neisseria flavescens NRL30031/H210]